MEYPSNWFNIIEDAVILRYNSMKVKGDVDNSVLAGFLLYDNESKELSVISLATGTKLMSGDIRKKTSSIGPFFVHDCHAEVLAHRCFQLWVWNELDSLFKNGTLDKKYTIHFYTSTPPCGDCCVHIKDGNVEVCTGAKPFGSDQSQLATSPPNVVRGKPGRGSRSQTVSCSDKLCLWLNSGLEGSLLSSFVERIFIDTVCIGNGNLDSCHRALFERVGTRPSAVLFVDSSKWNQKDDSPSAASFSWYQGSVSGELVASKFGRKFGVIEKQQTDPRLIPSICDLAMIHKYCLRKGIDTITIKEAKEKSSKYLSLKNIIKSSLLAHGSEWANKFEDEKNYLFNVAQMIIKEK